MFFVSKIIYLEKDGETMDKSNGLSVVVTVCLSHHCSSVFCFLVVQSRYCIYEAMTEGRRYWMAFLTTVILSLGIVEAIKELKDRNGSSMIAIKKVMQSKMPADKTWANRLFLNTLKAAVASGGMSDIVWM